MLKKKYNKGFTLVELLVVIAIIGILAVVAVPALFKNINKAKVADLEADYNAIKSATLSYYTDENSIPLDGPISSIAKYMDNVPTKSGLGEGSYTFKEEKLSSEEESHKSLFLVVGDRELKEDTEDNTCNAHETTHGDNDDCYTIGKGITLTSSQSEKLLSDMGDDMIYYAAVDSKEYDKLNETVKGENIKLAIKLIDRTSKI